MSKTSIECPTGKGDGKPGNWVICTTPLSCGLRVLEGWSEGVGIPSNRDNFESRFYALLKASVTYNKPRLDYSKPTPKGVWSLRQLDGPSMAPIGVSRCREQFLTKNRPYVLSSTEDWVDRFGEFIKKHDLGEFSRTHSSKNPSWSGIICVAMWTWNGNVPDSKHFPDIEVTLHE